MSYVSHTLALLAYAIGVSDSKQLVHSFMASHDFPLA